MWSPAEPIPTPVAVEDNLLNSSQVIATSFISPRTSCTFSETVTFNPTGSLDNSNQQNQSSLPIALIVGILLSVLGLAAILVSVVVVLVVRRAHKMERRKRIRPRPDSLDYNDIYESSTNIYSGSR